VVRFNVETRGDRVLLKQRQNEVLAILEAQ